MEAATWLERPQSVRVGCQIDGLGEADDGPELPPGTMRYPACDCRQHRAGQGVPDTSVRLSATEVAEGQVYAENSSGARATASALRGGTPSR